MSSEIVIVMGYNAAGKSTLVKDFVQKGYTRLNRDQAGGSMEALTQLAEKTLRDTHLLVLDNTYPSEESRKGIIAVAKRNKIPIRCYHLTTSLEDAQLNACLRMMRKLGTIPNPEDFKKYKDDPNTFPPAAIYKYRKEFQQPSVKEGFSQIVLVPFVRVWGPDFINKAVICDYDGTLRLCNDGAKFPTDPKQVKVLPNRAAVLKAWRVKGYKILGASNQSGVAKGDLTMAQAHACFKETNRQLGDIVEDYQFCTHRVPPITCFCRKPAPGMGAYFIERYKLLPSECIMVGDMGSDKTFAARCGFQYVDANEFFK